MRRKCVSAAAIILLAIGKAQAAPSYLHDCLAADAMPRLKVEACTFALQTESLSDEQRTSVLMHRARGYTDTFLIELAQQDLEEAAHLAPNDPEVIGALGDMSHFSGDRQIRAIAAYKQLLASNPTDIKILTKLGMAYVFLQNYQLAERAFSRVLAIDPNQLEALRWRTASLVQQGAFDRAFADIDHAVSLNEQDPSLRQSRAEIELYVGKFSGVITDLDVTLGANDKAPFFRFRGAAQYALGNFAAAAADFTRDLELVPAFFNLAVWRYLAEKKSGGGSDMELSTIADSVADDWTASLLRMAIKQSTLDQVLALAQSPNGDIQMVRESQAHFVAGELAMMAGDRKAAEAQFSTCRKHGLVVAEFDPKTGKRLFLPYDNVIEFAIAGERLRELSK
jgi:tetratricopeptide (TPR) repeat protein